MEIRGNKRKTIEKRRNEVVKRGTYLITDIILNSCPPPGSAVASSNSQRRIWSPGVRSVRIVIPLFISLPYHSGSPFVPLSDLAKGQK